MKRIITIHEFCDLYLEPLQKVVISDYDSERIYFKGSVKALLIGIDEPLLLSARIQRIDAYYNHNQPLSIELQI